MAGWDTRTTRVAATALSSATREKAGIWCPLNNNVHSVCSGAKTPWPVACRKMLNVLMVSITNRADVTDLTVPRTVWPFTVVASCRCMSDDEGAPPVPPPGELSVLLGVPRGVLRPRVLSPGPGVQGGTGLCGQWRVLQEPVPGR